MTNVLELVRKVNRIGVWLGGGLLILTSGLIALEVLLRKVFSISIGGSDELSSYVLAISCSWAFGFALLQKSHIRIDIIYARLPDVLKVFLDLLSLVIFLLYLIPLNYFGWLVFKTSLLKGSTANTPLQTPLWIPQGLWLAGLFLFVATMLIVLVATVVRLLKGDLAGAVALSGPTTLEEEIEESVMLSSDTTTGGTAS